jgi:DNA gyrase subunit B
MSEIQVLSQIEAVRKNPWMYVGSVGDDGAYHLVNEVIQNSIDESYMGFCSEIHIRILKDGIEIRDNGRGIPTELHPTEGVSSCEVALTRLHAGSKFQRKNSVYTTGIHGVGLSCVNALSDSLQVTIDRGGQKFFQEYVKGKPLSPIKDSGASDCSGTSIQFRPDPDIFKEFLGYEYFRIRNLVETLSFLNPGIQFFLYKNESSDAEKFSSAEGLRGIWKKLAVQSILENPLHFQWNTPEMEFEGYASWGTHQKETVLSYVNGVATPLAGSHVEGFRSGIFLGLTSWLKSSKSMRDKIDSIQLSDISDGWIAALHCKLMYPNFEGQTKSRLTNSEIHPSIEQEVADQVVTALAKNPKIASLILQRIIESKVSRIAAKRAAERVYLQNVKKDIDVEVYQEQFGERSKSWHQSAVWITHEELLKSHGDLCKVSKDAIALDVCCGSGVVGASFRPHVKKVIGLDLTPQMVNLAKSRLDEVVQGNVYQIPFTDSSFDLVCTREVLHLLPYPEKPVSEIYRVLKPGGQFIVGQILPFGEADAAWMYRVFKKKQPLIYNMFQEEDFRKLLLNAGFVDLEMKEMNVWESIDVWINSYETTEIHRHEIRDLFKNAPSEARDIHPFKILPSGEIQDLWRWCIFSVRKPS